jgi:hypothetical protein
VSYRWVGFNMCCSYRWFGFKRYMSYSVGLISVCHIDDVGLNKLGTCHIGWVYSIGGYIHRIHIGWV